MSIKECAAVKPQRSKGAASIILTNRYFRDMRPLSQHQTVVFCTTNKYGGNRLFRVLMFNYNDAPSQ